MSDGQRKEDLEYIRFVAPKFCNKFGEGYDFMTICHVLDLFCARLQSETSELSKICSPENKELYLSDEDLQSSIVKYGLDPEKFWYLILFLSDLTNTFYGEYITFEETTIKSKLGKMEEIVEKSTCKMTLDNGVDSVTIDMTLFNSELKTFVHTLAGVKEQLDLSCAKSFEMDDRLPHKIKTFMDMFDYFLNNFNEAYIHQRKGRKDWTMTAKVLFLVGYLKEYKGFEGIESAMMSKDKEHINSLKYVGKMIKDMTKNCSDSAHRENSCYQFIPDFE